MEDVRCFLLLNDDTFELALSVGPDKRVLRTCADDGAQWRTVLHGAGLVQVAGSSRAGIDTLRLNAGQLGRAVVVHPTLRLHSFRGCWGCRKKQRRSQKILGNNS